MAPAVPQKQLAGAAQAEVQVAGPAQEVRDLHPPP